MKIVLCAPGKNPQPWRDELASNFPAAGAEIWEWSSGPSAHDSGRQADYAVVWAPPPEFFISQPGLKAVFIMGAGADGVVSVSQLPGGIPIVRVNDAGMAVQMAEYVCHALIRHARGFDAYDRQAADRLWQPRPELDRSAWPVGVMGLGSIGARVAQSVAGFDYPVFGWARTPKHLPAIKSFAGPGQFDEFLCSVRVLVCVLPLTHETRGILDRRTLLKLRPGGYLINVARGGHLVEADLLELLDSGRLAGACLDVAADEPLGDGHPFWRNPKITLTPHISAITRLAESAAQIARKIHALERGEPVAGVVARDHGY